MTTLPLDLPIWMKRATRRTDWGALIALAFSLLAGWSFILHPGFSHMNANENYIFRTADYARSLSEARLYPRWTAETLNGYGAPIPHYAPPGAAYFPALIQLAFTNDPLQAMRVIYILSFVLAGTTMYALVTRRSGAASGLIAALLYVYSPYLALTAPHILGDFPVVIGLALLPTLLWSMDRLVLIAAPPDLLVTALTSAALLMTEPRIMGAATLIALIWLVFHESKRPQAILMPLVGVGFGVMIAAIFWLPALVEHDVVRWVIRALSPRPMINATGLFAPLRMLDPGEMIPMPQFTIGLASIGAVIASLPVILRGKAGLQGLFLLLGGGVIAVLITNPYEVWLMGIVAFALAVAGSAIVRRDRISGRWSRLILPITLAAILTLSFPVWLAPRSSEMTMDTSIEAQTRYEQLGFGIAVLPPDAPLPTSLPDTLTVLPGLNGKLTTIQSGGQIGILSHMTHSDTFQVSLFNPTSLQVLTSYFPGWGATFGDNSVRVMPHPDGGLMVNLPNPDRGELTISLGTTPPRLMGWIITLVSVGLVLLITIWRYQQRTAQFIDIDQLTESESRWSGVLLIGMLFALAFLSTGLFNPPIGYALEGSESIRVRTDVGLELLAYRRNSAELTLYWRTARFLPDNYQTQVSLMHVESGETLPASPLRHPGGYPTQRWLTNVYVTDPYRLTIPEAADYAAVIEVFAPNGSRITFFGENGSTIGQTLVLPINEG